MIVGRLGSALSLRGRSLRFQIVLLLLALLLISSLAVAAVTAFALRGFLIQRLDQQLVEAGNRFAVSLEHPDDHDADNDDQLGPIEGQSAGTLGARVLRGSVTAVEVVARGSDDSAISARDKEILGTLTPSAHPRTIRFRDLGEYRVSVTTGDDGDVLITGLPEHPVDDTIARLLVIETVVCAAALIVTGTVGALSVRLSLRPLRRVAATAREVSSRPLSTGTVSLPERVPVAAPHTEAGQVADAFNHMLEHVESALHERHASEDRLRQFIADASHELRTPVTVVRSHAEYAQRVGASELQPAVSEALVRITAESERMGHLVEDLLLLARLDSGRQLEHAPVDVTRIVLDAVADARVTGANHVWRLELPEEEVIVDGDGRALHQVVANLLANAQAHTSPGTTVTTTLAAADGEPIVITVHDDGVGIPAAALPRIFDRFVRADAARSRTDGSGLGLSIVAAIVNAHHGTVHATSRPGATSFIVTLPAPEVGSAAAAEGSQPRGPRP